MTLSFLFPRLAAVFFLCLFLPALPLAAKTEPVKTKATAEKMSLPPAAEPKKPEATKSYGFSFQSQNAKGLPLHVGGQLSLPNGKGPFPVMVMLHGSRGILPDQVALYREAFVKMGMAFLIIDSFTPRGVTTTSENQSLVSPVSDMVADATLALEALAKDKRIDVSRAGLFGFSKGGIATFATALENWPEKILKSKPKHRYKLYGLFYPGCAVQPFDLKTTGAPMYMFLGKEDKYTGTENCLELAVKLKVNGAKIQTIIYPHAVHGWDIEGMVDNPKGEVFRNCVFEQGPDGKWSERTSKVTGMESLGGEKYKKAHAGCVTYGSFSKEDKITKENALKDWTHAVKQHLLDKKK